MNVFWETVRCLEWLVTLWGLLWLTFGVGSVGNAQGSRVGVDAIRNHAIEDLPPSRNPVTCQQPHNARVTVVELLKGREGTSCGGSPGCTG